MKYTPKAKQQWKSKRANRKHLSKVNRLKKKNV